MQGVVGAVGFVDEVQAAAAVAYHDAPLRHFATARLDGEHRHLRERLLALVRALVGVGLTRRLDDEVRVSHLALAVDLVGVHEVLDVRVGLFEHALQLAEQLEHARLLGVGRSLLHVHGHVARAAHGFVVLSRRVVHVELREALGLLLARAQRADLLVELALDHDGGCPAVEVDLVVHLACEREGVVELPRVLAQCLRARRVVAPEALDGGLQLDLGHVDLALGAARTAALAPARLRHGLRLARPEQRAAVVARQGAVTAAAGSAAAAAAAGAWYAGAAEVADVEELEAGVVEAGPPHGLVAPRRVDSRPPSAADGGGVAAAGARETRRSALERFVRLVVPPHARRPRVPEVVARASSLRPRDGVGHVVGRNRCAASRGTSFLALVV
mmetsp:Transcript_3593/g.10502  ORF Transcript_3593/g.10502 Transcript_3593/m.10502 type:complete len:387 (+) Transcript_3593:812-1972(+)